MQALTDARSRRGTSTTHRSMRHRAPWTCQSVGRAGSGIGGSVAYIETARPERNGRRKGSRPLNGLASSDVRSPRAGRRSPSNHPRPWTPGGLYKSPKQTAGFAIDRLRTTPPPSTISAPGLPAGDSRRSSPPQYKADGGEGPRCSRNSFEPKVDSVCPSRRWGLVPSPSTRPSTATNTTAKARVTSHVPQHHLVR